MSFSCSDFQEAIVSALDLGPAIEKRYAEDETLTDDAGPAIAAELAAERIAELITAKEALAEVARIFSNATVHAHPFSVAMKRARRIALNGSL